MPSPSRALLCSLLLACGRPAAKPPDAAPAPIVVVPDAAPPPTQLTRRAGETVDEQLEVDGKTLGAVRIPDEDRVTLRVAAPGGPVDIVTLDVQGDFTLRAAEGKVIFGAELIVGRVPGVGPLSRYEYRTVARVGDAWKVTERFSCDEKEQEKECVLPDWATGPAEPTAVDPCANQPTCVAEAVKHARAWFNATSAASRRPYAGSAERNTAVVFDPREGKPSLAQVDFTYGQVFPQGAVEQVRAAFSARLRTLDAVTLRSRTGGPELAGEGKQADHFRELAASPLVVELYNEDDCGRESVFLAMAKDDHAVWYVSAALLSFDPKECDAP